jgi:integrase
VQHTQEADLCAQMREFKETVRAKRDRTILSTLLYPALRREELCKHKVSDFRHARRISKSTARAGKRDICRCIPGPTRSSTIISKAAGHGRRRERRVVSVD